MYQICLHYFIILNKDTQAKQTKPLLAEAAVWQRLEFYFSLIKQ